jgi:HlyD family secretion protein
MNPFLRPRSRVIAIGVIVIAVVAGIVYWRSSSNQAVPTFRIVKVDKGPITATVSASGTLNPVTSVQVGTQVSGQIKELLVDFNSVVKQGQLIARIDPETFMYRVRQAEADLEAARAAVGRAQVAMLNAKRDLDRSRELVAKNFASPADVDAKQAAYDLAAADVKNTQAVLRQRGASLASARVDLGRTEIRAPVNGVVIKRSVDVGQTVAASLQAPELFVIAKDLSDMQVETSIDEADVGRIRAGQRATFTVDAFPGRTFAGSVTQIRKAAQTVQNVVTYTVLVSASNEGGQLMPGMTANVRIVTDTRDNVLKVPNAALRFRPAGAATGETSPAKAGDTAKVPTDAGGGQGASGGNQMQQLRERLIAELKLDADQQAKLEPIFAATRTRFASLRDLPEEQRGKAAQAARAELRAKVEEILKPEQRPRYAELAAELAGRSSQPARGRVWVLDNGKPKAIDVRIGLTDGTATEVSGDGVVEGTEVIVGVQGAAGSSPAQKGAPPRMFF